MKDIKIFLRKKKEKKQQYGGRGRYKKISQKIKNKSLLSIEKNIVE